MSLVHQVLKDIDQRNQPENNRVPSYLQLPATAKASVPIWLISVFALAFSGAVAIYWYISFYQQPALEKNAASQLIDLDGNQNSVEDVFQREQTELSEPADTSRNSVQHYEETEISLHEIKALSDERSGQVITSTKKNSASRTVSQASQADIPKANAPKGDTPVIRSESSIQEGSHIEINRRDQKFQQDYVALLNLMQGGQWSDALVKVNTLLTVPLLNSGYRENLVSSKLRILLEMKDFSAFHHFFDSHRHIESLQWLSIAAPGLHMMEDYDTAIVLYDKLMKLQPKVVNWPIAMSLALESSGKNNYAATVLNNMSENYYLDPRQKSWVQQKLLSLR